MRTIRMTVQTEMPPVPVTMNRLAEEASVPRRSMLGVSWRSPLLPDCAAIASSLAITRSARAVTPIAVAKFDF
jgi:hypothetical protein